MGLAVAAVLGHDIVVFLGDDEVVTTADFMKRAVYALGHETRQGLPILAKSGYFFNEENSPFANTSKAGITNRWWTKRVEFNQWMRRALDGTSRAARTSTTSSIFGCTVSTSGSTTGGRYAIFPLRSNSAHRALCRTCTAGIMNG